MCVGESKSSKYDSKVKYFFCDDCKKEVDTLTHCDKCDGQFCVKCIIEEYNGGDYYDKYCKKCWNIMKPFRERIKVLEDKEEEIYKEMEIELKKIKYNTCIFKQ
mgnify:CR=1 FL=1